MTKQTTKAARTPSLAKASAIMGKALLSAPKLRGTTKAERKLTKALDATKPLSGNALEAAVAITGTRKATKGEQAALNGSKAKGGKPGQARANQSAQYTPEPKADRRIKPIVQVGSKLVDTSKATAPRNADTITSVKNDASGGWGIATTATGQTAKWRRNMETAELAKAAVVGGSLKAVQALVAGLVPPRAALAKGAEREVHSKAAAAASAKANNKVGQKAAPAKAAAAKTERAAKAAVNKPGADRAYKVIAKAHGRKAGTWTDYMLNTIMAHGSTAAATAAHQKAAAKKGYSPTKPLDFKWAADVAKVIAFK